MVDVSSFHAKKEELHVTEWSRSAIGAPKKRKWLTRKDKSLKSIRMALLKNKKLNLIYIHDFYILLKFLIKLGYRFQRIKLKINYTDLEITYSPQKLNKEKFRKCFPDELSDT